MEFAPLGCQAGKPGRPKFLTVPVTVLEIVVLLPQVAITRCVRKNFLLLFRTLAFGGRRRLCSFLSDLTPVSRLRLT
jgi:hypothetical protein